MAQPLQDTLKHDFPSLLCSSKQRLLGLGSEEALTVAQQVHEAEVRIAKAKEGTGFESEEEKDADNTKKKKYKKPNIIDV